MARLNIAVYFVNKLKELVEGLCLPWSNFLEINVCTVAQNLCEKVLSFLFIKQEIL